MKNIVLFGNARSVFYKTREVDARFDTICRINAGIPFGREEYLGSRTDILFLSLALEEDQIKRLNTEKIIWCTPKIEYRTKYIKQHSDKYPIVNWNYLYAKFKTRPSTGLMAFDYLLPQDFETFTLIGFDFWETPNWYTNNRHLAKHSPKAEKAYILEKIKEYKGKIIWER